MSFIRVLGAEFLKLKRCPIVLITLIAWLFMGSIAGLFLWIVSHPGMAASLGLIGQKASFAAGDLSADWPGLLAMVGQMGGLGGMILYSVIVSWLFGREYAEGTAKNLMALPLPRPYFALSKLLVSAAWMLGLTLVAVAQAVVTGRLLGLGGFSAPDFLSWAARSFAATLMVLSLGPSVALIATVGKGYMAPLGFTIMTLVVGTVIGATDWARWCPWSIVPLYSGAAGPRAAEVGAASLAVLVFFCAACLAALVLRDARADNVQ